MSRHHRRAGARSGRLVLAFTVASASFHLAAAGAVHQGAAPPATPLEHSVVLIVRSPGDERIVARLRGELAATGCHIVELRPDPGQTEATLARMATMVSAAAAVRVRPDAAAI